MKEDWKTVRFAPPKEKVEDETKDTLDDDLRRSFDELFPGFNRNRKDIHRSRDH